MRSQHKTFRIEQMGLRAESGLFANGDADAARRHSASLPPEGEIVAELKALRALLESRSPTDGVQAHLTEFLQLKGELDIIQDAISRTKREIAAVHVTGFNGPEMTRVASELGAVVGGTEQATQAILAAAEDIDQMANTLGAAVKSEHEQGLAHDIQDRVIQIFEACNFQDLTGQRVSKVVATLKFIEEHIVQMIDIWGGIEALKDFAPAANSDAKLVNGPKLDGDAGHVSQDDIDALFN
jgi:chemotaxis protein CheZ